MEKQKKILENAKIIGLGLFFPKQKLLCVSDLHLGYEEILNKQGVFVPRTNYKETVSHFKSILEKTGKPETILINGDLKHEFGAISEQEWSEATGFLELCKKNCEKIILVKGNHDTILQPIANWQNLEITSEFFLEKEKILFIHGHKIPNSKNFEQAKTIIIGNEHPAITLRDGTKVEKFKCFLKGKFQKKNLIVLPSLNFVSLGTNVLREKLLSPFLKQSLKNFEVWVVEDKEYYFGRLSKLGD